MAIIKGNSSGKSGSTQKTASPNGIAMKDRVGAGPGVNPNKGYPTAANVSGDRGGMPGFGGKGNGGARGAGSTQMGAQGSGHVATESKRSSNTGFGNVHKSLKGKL